MDSATASRRGHYGELYGCYTEQYDSVISDIKNRSDEHGWVEGGNWDKKGRGSQVTIDMYGADENTGLYVVQVRQSFRHRASHYLQTRKSYFLIGRNENGNAFAHCVGAHAIRSSINNETACNPKTAVNAACRWIWGTDRYNEILRHGDVGLLPVKSKPNIPEIGANVIIVIDSHQLWSGSIRKNGKLYAKNPYLHHIKNQHPDIRGNGWYCVIIGRREPAWSFAPVTVD